MELQHPTLLWHAYHAKDKIQLPDAQNQAAFDQGHEVGALGQEVGPGRTSKLARAPATWEKPSRADPPYNYDHTTITSATTIITIPVIRIAIRSASA